MLTLARSSGASTRLPLAEGSPLTLGRQHVPGAPRSVSSAQCRLTLQRRDGGGAAAAGDAAALCAPLCAATATAWLETLSASAPTLVICGATGARVPLPPGGRRELREGDAFALVAKAPHDALLTFSWGAPESGDTAAGAADDAGPAAKRARHEGGGAPAPAADVIDLTASSPQAAPPPQLMAPTERGARPILLILSGIQGSGKSTFCGALPAERWVRVCQDVVGNGGRPGSRQQCLVAALRALRAGRHVAIDRMHLSVAQRSDFLALAGALGCDAHAVALALPVELCAARVRDRVAHEGGVGGPTGAARARASARAADNAPPDAAAEGLACVTRCRTDPEAAAARGRYAAWPAAAAPVAAWQEPGSIAAISTALQADAAQRRRGAGVAGGAGASTAAAAPPAAAPQLPRSSAAAAAPAGAQNAFARLRASPARAAAAAPSPPPRAAAAPRGGAAWELPLVRAAASPEGTPGVVSYDDQIVVLRDAFPKAASHTLLVARLPGLDGPAQLRRAHAPLLAAMRAAAARVEAAERERLGGALLPAGAPFWAGFHAVPSMRQLHCHVISADLSSERMKNKKHW